MKRSRFAAAAGFGAVIALGVVGFGCSSTSPAGGTGGATGTGGGAATGTGGHGTGGSTGTGGAIDAGTASHVQPGARRSEHVQQQPDLRQELRRQHLGVEHHARAQDLHLQRAGARRHLVVPEHGRRMRLPDRHRSHLLRSDADAPALPARHRRWRSLRRRRRWRWRRCRRRPHPFGRLQLHAPAERGVRQHLRLRDRGRHLVSRQQRRQNRILRLRGEHLAVRERGRMAGAVASRGPAPLIV